MRGFRSLPLALALAALGCGDKPRAQRGGDAGPAVVVEDRAPNGTQVAKELEPNDEQPQRLTVPGAVRGTIGAGADVDRYQLVIDAPSVVRLGLGALDDADLVLEVLAADGARVAQSDNGPKGTPEGLPNLGLAPGTYQVVVREFIKAPSKKKGAPAPVRAEASAPYLLEVALVQAAPGDEVEPNDTAAFAGALALPGTAHGFAGWRKDRDVYRVPLAEIGEDEALTVEVDGVAEVALRVAVLDGTEAVLLERQGKAGEAITLKNVAVRAGEPAYFVVVAASGRGNVDDRYQVSVRAAPVELDEETEPNDTIAQAGPLAEIPGEGGMRVGTLPRGDTDVFALDPADAPRSLHLTVEPPPGVDVDLTLLDDKGQPVAPPADAGKLGAPERLANLPVPAGAKRFVRVRVQGGGDGQVRYRLRWSAAVAEPAALPDLDLDDPTPEPESPTP